MFVYSDITVNIRPDILFDIRDVPNIGVASNAKTTISGLISLDITEKTHTQEKLRYQSSKLQYWDGKKGLYPKEL